MSKPYRFSSYAWVAILLCACGFVVWTNAARVHQVQYVSSMGGLPDMPLKDDASSKKTDTYVAPKNWLVVTGHNSDSYHWIAQTQQMFGTGEWRVRHITYENAPFGRDVTAASPYRWWLGLVAWCDHEISGTGMSPAVERAALVADPLFQLLLLVVTTIFVAWRFGSFPAAFMAIGLAALFPFASEFLPGMPDDRGLQQACALWSILPVLAGMRAVHSSGTEGGARARRWFFFAGVLGGVGLWISVATEVPILLGIALGALVAAWISRGAGKGEQTGEPKIAPWGIWTLGGTVTCLACYLIEYFPSNMGNWQFRAMHPLYGVAWLGMGLLLMRTTVWIQKGKRYSKWLELALLVLALALMAVLPVVMVKMKDPGFWAADLMSGQLTKLSADIAATSLWSWMVNDGITLKTWTTVLPGFLVLPALWLLLRRGTGVAYRTAISIALGPVLVALAIAGSKLLWWNIADAALLALLVIVTVAVDETLKHRFTRWVWSGFASLILVLGVVQLVPSAKAGAENELEETDVYGLIERDLALWLAKQAASKGVTVLAPHKVVIPLFYYGGIPGLGAMSWDNQDGLSAAIRILSASTPEEARELIERRGITHIVIPSWDTNFDSYTRMGMGKIETTFYERLLYWKLPPWLKPVPFQIPQIRGFEGQSVTVYEVVEDQEDAAALCRIVEYFIEMGQVDKAVFMGQGLRRYPADLGAWVTRAQVEIARGDEEELAKAFKVLLPKLKSGADKSLSWDRRAGLAVVLARGKQVEQAREQVKRCLDDIDEAKLRSVTAGSLYRLQILAKKYGMTIADPRLKALALEMLPPEMRSRL